MHLLVLSLLISSSLFAEKIPYYKTSKVGTIQVHEEGEEGTFPRKGALPEGDPTSSLVEVPAPKAKEWMPFLCEALKTPSAIHFPTGDWKDGAPKPCEGKVPKAFWVDRGQFQNVGILKAAWPKKSGKLPGRNVLALLETDATQKPLRVLKIVGALNDAGDMSGEPMLEFVTEREIVLKFEGYVSQWQILLKRAPGKLAVAVEELR